MTEIKKRPPKETDQEEVEKAFNLLKECMENHPEIEPSLWAGACWSILVAGYSSCGFSYDQFTREWDEIKYHYKSWFDK